METSRQPITPETEALVQQHGGPLTVAGQQGDIVMMRSDVYIAMLGIGDNDEAETLASRNSASGARVKTKRPPPLAALAGRGI